MTPKRKLFLYLALLLLLPTGAVFAQADPISSSFTYASQIGGGALGTSNLQDIIVSIVNLMLSFLAIVFVNMIIWGGVQYYTGHLHEEEKQYAVATLKSAIIGMGFILFSMSISKFVLASVSTATASTLTF